MAIIISDIHGDIKKARTFLEYRPDIEHVILGDLVDSYNYGTTLQGELECLELILKSDAVLLWGNHDLAYTDKPCWKGFSRFPDALPVISKQLIPHADRFKAAYAVDGWLCTHAGVSNTLAKVLPDMPLDTGDPEAVADWLNEQFLHQRQIQKNTIDRQPYYGTGPLFARHLSRGGDDQYGGIFWYDPHWELAKPDQRVNQLFGHTPVPGPMKREEWNNINIACGCWVFDTADDSFVLLSGETC